MFKIVMNNNVMDTCRTYGQALKKAKKIKELFCKKNTFVVTVETDEGYVMDTL